MHFHILAVAKNADMGTTPPPRALPKHMISGVTFQWSTPKMAPVLPNPV
jgi:hypothetical protein